MRAQQNVLSIAFNLFIYLLITWKHCLAGDHHLGISWPKALKKSVSQGLLSDHLIEG